MNEALRTTLLLSIRLAAGYVQVFKLYGSWVAHDSTRAQVSQAIHGIRRRGLGLAVDAS